MTHSQLVPFALWAGLLALAPGTQAHDWYPKECCSDQDCALVDSQVARLGAFQNFVDIRRGYQESSCN